MKEKLVAYFVSLLVKMLSEAELREFADKVLDFAEAKIKDSENKYDDMVILPLCKLLRNAFDIGD